jgi:hypothetical protein
VAGSTELEACQRLADELQRAPRHIAGTIERVDLIEVSPTAVRTVARFGLGTAAC